MQPFPFDLSKVKRVFTTVIAVLALLLSVLNAVNAQLPSRVETLGTSNFDDLVVTSLTATTVTASSLVSQAVGFSGASATLTNDASAKYITATVQISTPKVLIGSATTLQGITFGSGSGTSAADAGTIAHTMGTTPTVCLLSQVGANTITRTVKVSSLDATNITLAATVGNTATVTFACYR